MNKDYAEFTGDWSLVIGRFQPLHTGHIKLIRKILNEGGKVCVGLRDTPKDEKNPYTLLDRRLMFIEEFKKEILENKLVVVDLPDIKEVVRGRKVGWGIRKINLDKKTESISATKIRADLRKIGALKVKEKDLKGATYTKKRNEKNKN